MSNTRSHEKKNSSLHTKEDGHGVYSNMCVEDRMALTKSVWTGRKL